MTVRLDPSHRNATHDDQRGMALVAAVMILTILSLLGVFIASSTVNDRRMTSDDLAGAKARRLAEAGVYEAMNRLNDNQGPSTAGLLPARKVVQVVLTSTPGTPGADTTLLATGQPAGQYLPYSKSHSGSGSLTIEFRTNAARTQIYRYDKNLVPPIQTSSGVPIYKITSTATVGPAKRTIQTEMTWMPPVTFSAKSALCAGADVKFTGNAIACGYNHRADTPAGTGQGGRSGSGGCNENSGASPPLWEWPTGTIAGIWSSADVSGSGAANAFGTPATTSNGTPFYAGPWEFLGMTQSDFYLLVGTPRTSMPANPSGITYVDNDAVKQNASGSYILPSGTGFLYVDGDLTINSSDPRWRGLIYCEGSLKVTGNSWILGAVVARGPDEIQFNGTATILYSEDAIRKYLPAYMFGGKPGMLSWKEM